MAEDVPKHWRLQLAAFTFVGLIVLAGAFYLSNRQSSGKWVSASGTVIRTGVGNDYDGNHPLLIVELADGHREQIAIPAGQYGGCNSGDRVALVRQGLSYRVALEGCSDPKPPVDNRGR